MTWRVPSLRLRTMAILIVVLVSSVLLWAQYQLNFSYTQQLQTRFTEKTVTLITRTIPTLMQFPLVTNDIQAIGRIVDELIQLEDIYAVEVRSTEGELLYRGEDDDTPLQEGIPISKQIIAILDNSNPVSVSPLAPPSSAATPRQLGTVVLYLTTAHIDQTLANSLRYRTLLFIAIVLGIVLALYLLSGRIQHYVRRLLTTMQRVNAGDFENEPPHWMIKEFTDIATGLDQLSADLQQTIDDLTAAQTAAEQADSFKGELIQRFSHELRTPVNTITNLFDLITRQVENSTVDLLLKSHIAICQGATQELRHIVEELLDFTQLEAGALAKTEKPFSLPGLFDELYTQYALRFGQQDIDFSIAPDQLNKTIDDQQLIIADKNKLTRILVNLLENAFKYTKEGRVTLAWHLDSPSTNTQLVITVADTGIGIPGEQLPHIFDKFYQVTNPVTREKGGWGLGLTFTKQLVDLLGGEIHVTSTHKVGSQFTVTLPVTRKHADDSVHPTSSTTTIPPDLAVMIVDDNANNSYTLVQLLKRHKITAVTETDPEHALTTLEHQPFDLLFVDYHMPAINGIQFIHEVRASRLNHSVVIICITADAHPSTQAQLAAEPIDGLLIKPVDSERLYQAIINSIAAKKAARDMISALKNKNKE